MAKETQETINAWQDRMFPNATRAGVSLHLIEELFELEEQLKQAIVKDWEHDLTKEELEAACFEAADVIILIYAWAKKHGISDFHSQFVDHKMSINRARDWTIQPDGTGRHK